MSPVGLSHKRNNLCALIMWCPPQKKFDNEMMCDLCGSILVDYVELVLIRCTQLNSVRYVFQDDLLNMVGHEFESNLFNRSDNDTIEIFLGKHWNCPQNVNLYDILCKVAEMSDICLEYFQNNSRPLFRITLKMVDRK